MVVLALATKMVRPATAVVFVHVISYPVLFSQLPRTSHAPPGGGGAAAPLDLVPNEGSSICQKRLLYHLSNPSMWALPPSQQGRRATVC